MLFDEYFSMGIPTSSQCYETFYGGNSKILDLKNALIGYCVASLVFFVIFYKAAYDKMLFSCVRTVF